MSIRMDENYGRPRAIEKVTIGTSVTEATSLELRGYVLYGSVVVHGGSGSLNAIQGESLIMFDGEDDVFGGGLGSSDKCRDFGQNAKPEVGNRMILILKASYGKCLRIGWAGGRGPVLCFRQVSEGRPGGQ